MVLVLILTTYIGALLRANTETTTSENIVHIVYPKFRSLDIVCKKTVSTLRDNPWITKSCDPFYDTITTTALTVHSCV